MDAGKKTAASTGTVVATTAFGVTVGMWSVAYISHLPGLPVSSGLAILALSLCIFTGGFFAGKQTERPSMSGCIAGTISAILNLLIIGSLLGGDHKSGMGSPAMWLVPGLFAAGILFGSIGGFFGGKCRTSTRPNTSECNFALSIITVSAVFMMISIGGLVTSYGAGLSVVDWPQTFGLNMFLYPLSRMTGGIYFEHTHRLFGTLVGLTAIALTVQLWRHDQRRWLRSLMLMIMGMIIFQGILGGLRVTGYFTLSDSAESMRPNINLAIIHGIMGQCLFSAMAAVCVFTSSIWKSKPSSVTSESSSTDRYLNIACILIVLAQIFLGAFLRHVGTGLFIHITIAVLVVLLCISSGIRAWGVHGHNKLLSATGLSLMFIATAQFIFGFGALITTGIFSEKQNTFLLEVIFTTIHQVTGAVLLATAVLITILNFRLASEE